MHATNRRRFMQWFATVAAVPWTRTALPALGAVAAATAAAQTTEEEAPPPEVGPWLEIVKQRWGRTLSPDDLKAIGDNLAWTARSGKTLRALSLQNADEPDVVFRAERPVVEK